MQLADLIKETIYQLLNGTGILEWCGVATGILCVWLAAKNSIWNWPIAIISVLIYVFIFFESKLYADMGLQLYFFAMNIYGWYYWSRQKHNSVQQSIGLITLKQGILALVGIVIFTFIIGFFLHQQTDASFPFIDSFCAACSVVAQIFLARRIIQNWLLWIFIDIIYVSVYFTKELYATGLMYVLYIVIATIGYLDWKKIYREQNH